MNELTPYSDPNALINSPPAVLSTRPNLLLLLKALRRRWASAISLGVLVGCCAAVGMWFVQPPRFLARTTFRVPMETRLVKVEGDPQRDPVRLQKTHEAFVKSRSVLGKTLEVPEVAELEMIRTLKEPIDWLEKHLQADFNLSPEILRIQITGDNPDELLVLIKALQKTYKEEFCTKEKLDREEQLKTTQELLKIYRKRLEIYQKDQEKVAKEGKALALNERARALELSFANNNLAIAEAELRRAKSDLDDAVTELETLKDQLDNLRESDISDAAVQAALEKDPVEGARFSALLNSIGALALEIEEAKKTWTKPDDIHIRTRQANLKAMQRELAGLRNNKRPKLVAQMLKSKREDLLLEIKKKETKIDSLRHKRKVFEEDFEHSKQTVLEMTNKDIKIEDVNSNMAYLVRLVSGLENEEEGLHILMDTPIRIIPRDDAYVSSASGPSRLMAAAMAGMAGFLAICFMISWREFQARRIESVDEIIQGLGLQFVGAIPTIPRRWFRSRAKKGDYSQHLLIESIETTRTMLLEATRAESSGQGEEGAAAHPQVVMITSAQAGEGKTSVSSHLAVSLAQIGHKTLLIDADMRNPSAHRIVGLSCEPGCSELLRGEVDLADAIRATPIAGLWLISGGKWDTRATRALAQPRAAEVLQELRQNFDFIVIDTPPVLPVADPLLIAKHADVVVFSVLCNVSRMRNVYTACQRLHAVGVRAVRTVISGVRGQDYDSSYQYLPKVGTKV